MSRREKLRKNMLEDIKNQARQQMAENGTAAISLSGIARALEVSQPALYRYYASRDELITALIVDVYNDQANGLEQADRDLPENEYSQRLLSVLLVYRAWAIQHPTDFQLIYGNPIPGYHAPDEITTPAARRNFSVILNILSGAYRTGALKPAHDQELAAEKLGIHLPDLGDGGEAGLPLVILYIGLVGMYRLHGMIMLELFNHIQEMIPDPPAFYRHEVESLMRSVGMEV
jgi:AcrR family transcriptional regulator